MCGLRLSVKALRASRFERSTEPIKDQIDSHIACEIAAIIESQSIPNVRHRGHRNPDRNQNRSPNRFPMCATVHGQLYRANHRKSTAESTNETFQNRMPNLFRHRFRYRNRTTNHQHPPSISVPKMIQKSVKSNHFWLFWR